MIVHIYLHQPFIDKMNKKQRDLWNGHAQIINIKLKFPPNVGDIIYVDTNECDYYKIDYEHLQMLFKGKEVNHQFKIKEKHIYVLDEDEMNDVYGGEELIGLYVIPNINNHN
jgi:hypothetical protein